MICKYCSNNLLCIQASFLVLEIIRRDHYICWYCKINYDVYENSITKRKHIEEKNI